MRSTKLKMASLLMLPAALGVSACEKQVRIQPVLPPVADLRVEAKPVPPLDIVEDATAEARYNSGLEAWGERGWAAVARVCRWAMSHGSTVDCLAVEGASNKRQ